MPQLKRAVPERAGLGISSLARRLRWRIVVAVVSAVSAATLTTAIGTLGPGLDARAASPIMATLTDCPSLPGTVTCGIWSGYEAEGVNVSELDAIIDVPQITCPADVVTGEMGFWVGVQGTASDGTTTIVQPGVAWSCDGGQPAYYAFTTNMQGAAMPRPDTVSPGDAVYLQVTTDGAGNYVQQIVDFTAAGGFWNESVDESGGPVSAELAAFAAESFDGGVDSQQEDIAAAAINGQPLGQYNPTASAEDPAYFQGASALVPSALDSTGQDFQLSWDLVPRQSESDIAQQLAQCCSSR